MRRLSLAAIAAALALSCATTGHKFDMQAADSFQPGITTEAQATEALGPPTSQIFNADGTKLVTWLYGRATTIGSSSKVLTIQFDHDGKMMGVFQKLDG